MVRKKHILLRAAVPPLLAISTLTQLRPLATCALSLPLQPVLRGSELHNGSGWQAATPAAWPHA